MSSILISVIAFCLAIIVGHFDAERQNAPGFMAYGPVGAFITACVFILLCAGMVVGIALTADGEKLKITIGIAGFVCICIGNWIGHIVYTEEKAPKHVPMQQASLKQTPKDLTWRCTCGEVNIKSHTRCRSCDSPR